MAEPQEILKSYKQIFIVCDRNVEALARMSGDYPLLSFHASEQTKTFESVLGICRWLLEQNAGRDSIVLAVGGGVTTDVVGFAASIYKRGIAYADIPTTLLAMVDAGIGGKTGVNLDSYKNMLGSFRQPAFVRIYPEVLRSLPKKEFLSGAAEMLKTFIISNKADSYARAVRLFTAYSQSGRSPLDTPEGLKELSDLISAAVAVKQEIVDKDPLEKGERRVLNLGHTWAHAIEWRLPGQFTHGEAVAIGIVQAARKAESLGLAEKGLAEHLTADFTACGLPTELPCPEQELLPAMRRDKKADGDGGVQLVLPVKIGKVTVKSIEL